MPGLIVDNAIPERFPGDFVIDFAVGAVMTQAETVYRDRVRALLDELQRQHAEDDDPREPNSEKGLAWTGEVLASRKQFRIEMAAWLRAGAAAVQAGTLEAEPALDNAELARATWRLEQLRLSRKLFFVRVIFGDFLSDNDEPYAVDLSLVVRDGLPPPQDKPSEEKQALFIDLYSALTVMKAVCRDLERQQGSLAARFMSKKSRLSAFHRSARTLDTYVRKLQGIAELGLSQSQTSLAKVALLNLKQEVLSQQARRIKNAYVAALGLRALVLAACLFLPYVLISLEKFPVQPVPAGPFGAAWWLDHSSFLLVGIGAAVGTWLSFSIRNVQLTFEQLGSVETDLLNPTLRLLFVLGLTLAAYLLFWTGVLGISVGALKVDVENLKRAGSIAFLVGLLCGLSERALATAISGRSAAFVGAMEAGGAAPSPRPAKV